MTDVVRKRKIARDFEDLEFRERVFALKEKETRLSFEIDEKDFALKEKDFALKEKDFALKEKDLRLSVEIDEKKFALKKQDQLLPVEIEERKLVMQQKCKTSHKAMSGHARAAAVAMPMSRAVQHASAPPAATVIYRQTVLYSDDPGGPDKTFFYSVPKS